MHKRCLAVSIDQRRAGVGVGGHVAGCGGPITTSGIGLELHGRQGWSGAQVRGRNFCHANNDGRTAVSDRPFGAGCTVRHDGSPTIQPDAICSSRSFRPRPAVASSPWPSSGIRTAICRGRNRHPGYLGNAVVVIGPNHHPLSVSHTEFLCLLSTYVEILISGGEEEILLLL